jgi:hypothetical protein
MSMIDDSIKPVHQDVPLSIPELIALQNISTCAEAELFGILEKNEQILVKILSEKKQKSCSYCSITNALRKIISSGYLPLILSPTITFCKTVMNSNNNDAIVAILEILQSLYDRYTPDDYSILPLLINLARIRDDTKINTHLFFGTQTLQCRIRRKVFVVLWVISRKRFDLWSPYMLSTIEQTLKDRKTMPWQQVEAIIYSVTACLSMLIHASDKTETLEFIDTSLQEMLREEENPVLITSILNALRFYHPLRDATTIQPVTNYFISSITSPHEILRNAATHLLADVISSLIRLHHDAKTINEILDKFLHVLNTYQVDSEYLQGLLSILDYVANEHNAKVYCQYIAKISKRIFEILPSTNNGQELIPQLLYRMLLDLIERIQQDCLEIIDPFHWHSLDQIEEYLHSETEPNIQLYFEFTLRVLQYTNDPKYLERIQNVFLIAFSDLHHEHGNVAKHFAYEIASVLAKRKLLTKLVLAEQTERELLFDELLPEAISEMDQEDIEETNTSISSAVDLLGVAVLHLVGLNYDYYTTFEEHYLEDVIRILYGKVCEYLESGINGRLRAIRYALALARVAISYIDQVSPLLFTFFGAFLCESLLELTAEELKDAVSALERMMRWHLEEDYSGTANVVHGSHKLTRREFADSLSLFIGEVMHHFPELHAETKGCSVLVKVMRRMS